MKKVTILVLVTLSVLLSNGQSTDSKYLKGMKPRAIGPAGMSGRVTSIDVNPRNDDHILIGTASGGVWQSDNGGITWNPIFDKMPVQSIGAVAFDPSNPDVMWVGTGEGNPRNSQNSGKGLYKSMDGGENWKLVGLENSKTIHRIIIDSKNSNTVYIASLGSAWGPNEERGVFKTIDGGANWDKILYVNDSTGCADLIVDPTNPNKMFAAMWQYQRQPWFFNSGGKGSGLYVTHDAGVTWVKRTEQDGLPNGNLGRMGLAISANNPKVVYALVESKTYDLYKSHDGGIKWSKINNKNIGNRPFYYADLYADPSNENTIYSLFSWVNKSTDGGKNFTSITPYYKIHPDHHAFWINPKNGNHIIGGNDGGLTISKDGGKNWRYVTNLPLAQFYHINIDNEIPYNIYGGMQDNGSWKGPAYIFEGGGIRNHHWEEVGFGDGFDVVPLPNDHNQGYSMSQGGNVQRYNLNNGRKSTIKPLHPEHLPLRFNWNAAIAQDPFNDCGVYFGSQFVHYSSTCGNSWDILSPDLTTNDSTKQKQAKSGGLTIDATQAENFTTILCIAPSPIDSNLIWVSTDDGNLQKTTDKGKNWSNLSSQLPGLPKGAWIPQIHVSNHSADEVYVVANDYRRNNWEPYLYRTINGGTTWTRIVNSEKVKGHVWSAVQDTEVKDLLFCGTDFGLYVSYNGGNDWILWNEGIPCTPVSDLKIHPVEGDLIVGTFGRAVFVLDDIEPLREISRKRLNLEEEKFIVFEPKTHYRSPWKIARGIHFPGDAEFKGTNRSRGAQISLYINPSLLLPPNKGDKKDTSKPKVKGPSKVVEFLVLNENNDTVRFSKFTPDSMLNRFHWNQREDGVDWLMRGEKKVKKEDEKYKPAGLAVLPGKYKIKMFYKEFKDSCMLEIKQNPNYAIPMQELDELYRIRKGQQEQYSQVVKEVNKLKTIKASVTEINGLLGYVTDSIADSLRKEGEALTDSVNLILDEFFLPEGFVGYDHVSVKLSNKIWRIQGYLNSENALNSQMLDLAILDFEFSYEPVRVRMLNLFEKQWLDYQIKVDQLEFDYFKKFKDLNTEQ
ncbi:MAG: hypothetical protein ACPGEG_04475 [Salibacteraceae bacterium]